MLLFKRQFHLIMLLQSTCKSVFYYCHAKVMKSKVFAAEIFMKKERQHGPKKYIM